MQDAKNAKNPTIDLVEKHKADIENWKQTHKTVKLIKVKSKYNGDVAFIIGKPTATMLDAFSKYESDGKPHKVTELLIGSCVKAGPTELFSEDVDLKNAVLNRVSELLERLEVEEKEL